MSAKIDFNPLFQKAVELVTIGTKPLFVTGRAGTGKSTLLRHLRDSLILTHQIAVVAPTGVAAINIDGDTIHSFFRLKPGAGLTEARQSAGRILKTKRNKLYQKLDILIIDEISMVRADLLDCVNVFLQTVRGNSLAFGGVRVVFFGDLYQLPPVLQGSEKTAFEQMYDSPYFFDSHIISSLMGDELELDFIELDKIYRQTDTDFIDLLNKVRDRDLDETTLSKLNSRVISPKVSDILHLTATNAQATEINDKFLSALSSKSKSFQSKKSGDFERNMMVTSENLTLKVGSRVMLLANDSAGRYVNGSLGVVEGFYQLEKDDIDDFSDDLDDIFETQTGIKLDWGVKIRLDHTGETELIAPFTWEMGRTTYDEKANSLVREKIGSFTQIPVCLAWAITIHKSQGKTFDTALIDLGRGAFAPGQTYVALSRLTSMEGLFLQKDLKVSDVRLDFRILKFLTKLQYKQAEDNQSKEDKLDMVKSAIKSKTKLKMIYLKGKNQKSERIITPSSIGMDEFKGVSFTALRAYCHMRADERIFNFERILSLEVFSE